MIDSVDAELSARRLTPGCGSWAARTRLQYDPTDPYAIIMTVHVRGQDEVRWLFSRELLDDGLRQASGDGDISIAPCPNAPSDLLHVTLRDDVNSAVLELRAAPIVQFIRMTYGLVPSGDEGRFLTIEDDVSQAC
jgi:hypothetical protein